VRSFLPGCALILVFAALCGIGQSAWAGNLTGADSLPGANSLPGADSSTHADSLPGAGNLNGIDSSIESDNLPGPTDGSAGESISTGASTASRPSTSADPVALYNQRQYRQALAKFKEAAKKNPKDSKAHYYMAMCYQGMNQIKIARDEYMWVYQNANDQRMRYNSWAALSNIERWSAHRAYEGQGNVFGHRSNRPPVYRPMAVIPVYTPSSGSA
jgi:tetratricopeptide (TPR) repeat protein